MAVKVPTKEEIVSRIKQGPVQFIELANGQHARNGRARIAARQICDELVESGEVLYINIGYYSYYIANTEKAKRAAIRQQIEERSRIDKETGCVLWGGTNAPMRGPTMVQPLSGSTSGMNIRRWLFSDLIGRELNGLSETIRMRPSCDEACINVKHMTLKSRSEILSGTPKSLKMRLALYKTVCKKHGTNFDHVEAIRNSDKTASELALIYNMDPSNVAHIKRGATHKLSQGHWAGLVR